MGELSNIKTLGGIGSLLLLIGLLVPFAGFIILLIGLILTFIAVKTFSEKTKQEDIFKNYLRHFILIIIGIISAIIILSIGFTAVGGIAWVTSIQNVEITDMQTFLQYYGDIVGYALCALVIAWICIVISAIYLQRSYNDIAEQTNVALFRTTAKFYLYGSLCMIILIGFIIIIIGKIIEIIAYFSLPDDLHKGPDRERRCPHCQRIIPEDSNTCPYCSKNLI